MKLNSLLLACLAFLAAPLFAAVGGGSANSGNPGTQTSAGMVNSANGLYTVTITPTFTGEKTTVASLGGDVTLTKADGTTVRVDIGTGLIIGPDGQTTTESLASIVAQEKAAGDITGNSSVTASLAQALKVVADHTAAGEYGNDATTLLTSLVKVLVKANPEAAAEYVATAVSGATASTSSIPANEKMHAVAAIANVAGGEFKGMNGRSMRREIQAAATTAAMNNGMSADVIAAAQFTSLPPVLLTPITAIDPTVITVSPSGGNQ